MHNVLLYSNSPNVLESTPLVNGHRHERVHVLKYKDSVVGLCAAMVVFLWAGAWSVIAICRQRTFPW